MREVQLKKFVLFCVFLKIGLEYLLFLPFPYPFCVFYSLFISVHWVDAFVVVGFIQRVVVVVEASVLSHLRPLSWWSLTNTKKIEEMPNTTVTTVATIKNTSKWQQRQQQQRTHPSSAHRRRCRSWLCRKGRCTSWCTPCRRFLSKKIHGVKLCPALVTLAFKKQSTHA